MPSGSPPLTRRALARAGVAALTAAALPAAPAHASTPGQPYYDRARRLAGDHPVLTAIARALHPDTEFPGDIPAPPPTLIFDDLAVLSTGFVHAMALTTDRGIVLFDALASPADARDVIEPGLRELGADPADLHRIVITHGHYDHFGGARYLADRHGARVMMAPADWDLIERERPDNAPERDLDITDGQELALGSTTVALHRTPGHTPGTVSPLFGVHHRGRRHTAMLWGGTNPPTGPAGLQDYRDSIASFRRRMRRAGADAELSNHPNDHGLPRIEQMHEDPRGPNPFVLGRPCTDRFMAVMDLMIQGRLADARA